MKFISKQVSLKGDKDEKVWVQIVAICIACLSAITYGLIVAWTSPFLVKITNDKVNYDITPDQASILTYIPQIAMVISCTFFSMLSDRIGRKRTLMMITLPHCASWICTIVSKNIYVFYVARVFGGIADGCLLVTLPVYIGEVAVPKVRGIWGNLVALCTYLGIFLINIIGSQTSIEITAFICLPLPFIFLFSMHFLPETPYWYIMHGKDEDAKKSLRILRGIENVDAIFINLKDEIDKQMKERGTWKDLVMVPANRRGLVAGIFLRISQLFGGVGAFISYTQYIFVDMNMEMASEIPTIIFSAIILGLLSVSGYVIERIGKKRALMITSFLNSFVLALEAVYFYLESEKPEVNISTLKWFAIIGLVLYAIFCSFGTIPIPNIMLGELFSTNIKAKAISVLIVTFGLTYFASNVIFFLLNTRIGMYGPFVFFAVSNFLSTIFAYYLLPETSGKTLEEIQMLLK